MASFWVRSYTSFFNSAPLVRTHQFAKPEVLNVFIFSSACNYFLLFDVFLFPLVAFALFRDLSHKNA